MSTAAYYSRYLPGTQVLPSENLGGILTSSDELGESVIEVPPGTHGIWIGRPYVVPCIVVNWGYTASRSLQFVAVELMSTTPWMQENAFYYDPPLMHFTVVNNGEEDVQLRLHFHVMFDVNLIVA